MDACRCTCCQLIAVPLSNAHVLLPLLQDFIESFNNHRRRFFQPGKFLVVDESFAEWLGLGGSYINIGLPMFVAIKRKPHSGCEIQDSADGDSGVMLRLALVKSANEAELRAQENPKAWTNWDIIHGGKILFELIEPWLNTGRVVTGDSAFTSVGTAQKLEEHNTGMIGSVKLASSGFPMTYLSTVETNGQRGGRMFSFCF